MGRLQLVFYFRLQGACEAYRQWHPLGRSDGPMSTRTGDPTCLPVASSGNDANVRGRHHLHGGLHPLGQDLGPARRSSLGAGNGRTTTRISNASDACRRRCPGSASWWRAISISGFARRSVRPASPRRGTVPLSLALPSSRRNLVTTVAVPSITLPWAQTCIAIIGSQDLFHGSFHPGAGHRAARREIWPLPHHRPARLAGRRLVAFGHADFVQPQFEPFPVVCST